MQRLKQPTPNYCITAQKWSSLILLMPEPMQTTEMWKRLMLWIQSHNHCPPLHGNDCPELKNALFLLSHSPNKIRSSVTLMLLLSLVLNKVQNGLHSSLSLFGPMGLNITQHIDPWILLIPRVLPHPCSSHPTRYSVLNTFACFDTCQQHSEAIGLLHNSIRESEGLF